MIIITPETTRFTDSDRPGIAYRLPSGLSPSRDRNGRPSILVVKHEGGGSISLDLEASWPEMAENEFPAPLAAARFRLHAHTPAQSERGEWHDAVPHSIKLVRRTILLTPTESSIIGRLLEADDETFSIDVELTLRGRTKAYPWRLSADTALLVAKLTSLLPGTPNYRREDIVRAFAGLENADVDWFPQSLDAFPVPPNEAFFALANHLLPVLFERSADSYQFVTSPPQTLAVNLAVPVATTVSAGLTWSLSDFISQQSNPEQFVYDIKVDTPFEMGELLVTNDLPLHASGIRKLDVEVRTGGPSSEINHSFVPGEANAARLDFISETFRDQTMEAKVTAVVMKSGRPVLINKSVRQVGAVLSIDKALMQVEPVRVEVQSGVFDHIVSLEVSLGSRLLTLTKDAPEQWAVRSSPPAEATLVGITQEQKRIELGSIAAVNGHFTITELHLGVGELVDIVFTRSPNSRPSVYLAVRTELGQWRTLDESELKYGKITLPNKWDNVHFNYQTRHVPLATNGSTGAMVESSLQMSASPQIVLDM